LKRENQQRKGRLGMFCEDSKHSTTASQRTLKAVWGQVEINTWKEDSGNRMEKKVQLGKVLARVIRMAIALGTNLHCQPMSILVFELSSFQFRVPK
jgi:hypothetical protein